MRIGIDIRDAAPGGPGQQRYLWRLGCWLATRGHDCHFLTVRPQPPGIATPEGVTLDRLDGLSRAELRTHVTGLGLDVLLLNPERARRYRGLRANVLRAGYGTEHYSQKLRSFRAPLESAARRLLHAAPWARAERRWERAFYEGGAHAPDVIAQSAYMKDQILSSYSVPEGNVHVVHNGVDLEEFSTARHTALRAEARARWGLPDEATCLLFLGHNYRLKGLWHVLEALPRVRASAPVRLLVVGRGTGPGQRRKAERLVRRYGLEGQVTLAGSVPSSMVALAAADALLHLSWHDSFGFVALEAVACGLPVVTTRYTGASELVEEGVTGRLVEPDDGEALVAAIEDLTDAGYRLPMGEKAAARAEEHGEERNFAEVLGVLTRASERTPGPIGE